MIPNHGSTGAGTPSAPDASAVPDNPLLSPWTGPFGGLPPFDRVRVDDMIPALDEAIAGMLADVDRVANDPAPPDFRNTLEAFERAGESLDRLQAILGVWRTSMSSPEFQAIEGEIMVKLTDLAD